MAVKKMAPSSSIVFFILLISFPLSFSLDYFKYPAAFNFGDSNSDTGDIAVAKGITMAPVYGSTFFHQPNGRFCDGRLIVDFLMSAMELPFLNGYLDGVGLQDYKQGCNFAAAGSTITPANSASFCPFSLDVQIQQFLKFKSRVQQLRSSDSSRRLIQYLPDEDSFSRGLYMFDIGQNDVNGAFWSKSYDQVIAMIPNIISMLENAIQTLYQQGARNFWIHNTGPNGCLAENLAQFGNDPSKLDALGCLVDHNEASKEFNKQLLELCQKLRRQHADANVTYVDIFSIKHELIMNYLIYGFDQAIMACCGYGGAPLNFNRTCLCGQTTVLNGITLTAPKCEDSSKFVNWDGTHYTEAANKHVTSRIFTGNYTDPRFANKLS